MKQNITIKQLNELSEEGKDKLKKWYFDTYGIIGGTSETVNGNPFSNLEVDDPLLSIGQMVEFLDEKSNLRILENLKEGWDILRDKGSWTKEKELCDALWRACKEILENDK